MEKFFTNKYSFALVGLLLVLAFFFEYLFAELIPNKILLLTTTLIFDFAVLVLSINYVSRSTDFQENTWIKPRGAMYKLIGLTVLFTIVTIYNLVTVLLR